MDFTYRKRRRSTSVRSTRQAAAAGALAAPRAVVVPMPVLAKGVPRVTVVSSHTSFAHITSAVPPRVVVVPRPVGRRSAPSVTIIHTAKSTPSILATPRMPWLRPQAVRRSAPAAIVVSSRQVLPIIPASRKAFVSARPVRPPALNPRPIVVSTRIGTSNLPLTDNFRRHIHVTPRFPGRPRTIVTSSLKENRPIILPYPDPIVVPRLARGPGIPLRAITPTLIFRTTRQIITVHAPIVVPRLARTPGQQPRSILPPQNTRQPLATVFMPPPSIVVPRRPLSRLTRPFVLHAPALKLPQSVGPVPSIVVPRLFGRKPAPRVLIRSSVKGDIPAMTMPPYWHAIVSPRMVGRVLPTRAQSLKTHIPITDTPDPIGGGYPDIIAASIAWLRTNATLVAAFGDSHSAKADKFTSDTEARGINPPYAVFHEPQEFESFESKDPTGFRSSVVEGQYTIEVFTTGKLTTRQLSLQVGNWLSDSPLVFDEGLLIYIKAVERQYPTLRVSGPGENIVMFKRAIDFEYKFEKYILGS